MRKRPVRRPRKTLRTTIANDPWSIVFRRIPDGKDGEWGWTYWTKREIHIDPRVFNPAIVGQYKVPVTPREIALHEYFHARMPWMDEIFLDHMAQEADAYLDELDL